MDTFIVQFTDNLIKLKNMFGWWALALVGATFLVMLPINFSLKKLFALGKESVVKNRFRKVLASALVFVVSGGLIAAFLVYIDKTAITFDIIYQGAIPCSAAAMLINYVYKFIRDTGFEGLKQLFIAVAKSNQFKNATDKLIPDKYISSLIRTYVEESTKDIDTSDVNKFMENVTKQNTTIIKNIEAKVTGFVDNPKQTALDVLKAFIEAKKSISGCNQSKTA